MKTIYGLRGYKAPLKGTVLAIGVFDGVHTGHKEIISRAVAAARKRNIESVVLTFDPHPAKILRSEVRVRSLMSLEHRIRIIEDLGVDSLIVMRFSPAMANIEPEDFVRNVLVRKLGVREICVGDNFYFGRRGRSGVNELRKLGRSLGFSVNVVKPIRVGNNIVSSSRIRKLITSGRLREASKMIGRRVSVLGTVIGGARLARELGYPTANLNPHHEVIPPGGVYAVRVRFKDKIYRGVLNIGLRPTFYAPRDREPAIEVHIFGFKGKIYGRLLEVLFVKKLRDEIAFAGKLQLIEQIKKDEKDAKIALKQIVA